MLFFAYLYICYRRDEICVGGVPRGSNQKENVGKKTSAPNADTLVAIKQRVLVCLSFCFGTMFYLGEQVQMEATCCRRGGKMSRLYAAERCSNPLHREGRGGGYFLATGTSKNELSPLGAATNHRLYERRFSKKDNRNTCVYN